MRKWSSFLLGFLLTTTIACNPISEQVGTPTAFPQTPSPTPYIVERPTDVSEPTPVATPTAVTVAAPLQPTAIAPQQSMSGYWIGGESIGMQIAVPNSWVDFTADPILVASNNQLGLPILLAADGERTGKALLGGKPLGDGAYVTGLITNLTLPDDNPQTGLEHLLESLPTVVAEGEAEPFVRVNDRLGTTAVAGAYVDVLGHLPESSLPSDHPLQIRILLFTFDQVESTEENQSQIAFLFGTTPDQWSQYEPLFSEMAETIIIHQIRSSLRLGDGTVTVIGDLQSGAAVRRTLNSRGRDLWTFRVDGQQYASFTVAPNEAQLDLALRIFDPSGKVITTVDNGFAGDTETVADVPLDEPGVYIIEVSDFSDAVGNYELQYDLTKTPLFATGGHIKFGQSVQSILPLNNQHLWTFDGVVDQPVSIVLMPNDEAFDAILDLYGPDGTRLVALDEGFSGDSEVISGFQLPVTGEYTILVRNFAGETAAYSLALDEGGESTLNFYDAGDLMYGAVKDEILRFNEAQAWFFSGRTSDEIMVKVSPINAELDLEVWVLDPDVNRLGSVDIFGAGQPETMELTLNRDGEHLILVRDFFGQAGAYQIQLMAIQAEQPTLIGELVYGQTAVGEMSSDQATSWGFEGEAGDRINVVANPAGDAYDLVLTLLGPNGQTVLTIDAAENGAQEELAAFPLTENGRWQIVIEEFFGQAADYTVLLEKTP